MVFESANSLRECKKKGLTGSLDDDKADNYSSPGSSFQSEDTHNAASSSKSPQVLPNLEIVTVKEEPPNDNFSPVKEELENDQLSEHTTKTESRKGSKRPPATPPPVGKRRRGRPRKNKMIEPDEPESKRHFPYCTLCARGYAPEQGLKYLETAKSRAKLETILGVVALDPANRVVCPACWCLVELVADFRACCLKATEWAKRHAVEVGNDVVGERKSEFESWLSDEATQIIDRTRTTIRHRTASIETDNVALRRAPKRSVEAVESETLQDASPERDDDNDFDYSFGEMLETSIAKSDDLDYTEEGCIPEIAMLKGLEEDTSEKSDDKEQETADVKLLKIPVYTCEKCNRSFDTRNGRTHHANTCSGPDASKSLHSCSICSADFVNRSDLQSHLNKHKGIKPFKCRKNCSSVFYTISTRLSHERRCASENHICSYCGALLRTHETLAVHVASVHGEPRIPCEICHVKFKTRKQVRRHMAVHSDVRDFPCTVCDKAFKTAFNLRVHMRIHTQEKPFSCNICGQGFAYKCSVQPHIQRAHGGGIGQ